MRCLKCWKDLDGEGAIFTKSCQHVFCKRCSQTAFKKDLSCPLCDTVLPKDGVGQMVLNPDNSHLKKMAAKLFGLEPHNLCHILKLGLEFWANQQKNESIQHIQQLSQMKEALGEAQTRAQKLAKALDDERLKKKSLQNENESLQTHISDLESRYAEKSRSMRKLSELYSELRQIHKRLEVDLRGIREPHDYDREDGVGQSAVEVQVLRHSGHHHEHSRGAVNSLDKKQAKEQVKGQSSNQKDSAQISYPGGRIRGMRRMSASSKPVSSSLREGDRRYTDQMNPLFELAPKHESNAFELHRRDSSGTGKNRRRVGRGGL